jgi:hypothetical protein
MAALRFPSAVAGEGEGLFNHRSVQGKELPFFLYFVAESCIAGASGRRHVAEPDKLSGKYIKYLAITAASLIALGVIVKLVAIQAAGKPQILYSYASKDVGDDIAPDIAFGKGKWVVVWSSDDGLNKTKKTDWDLLYTTSSDGQNWGQPQLLATDPALNGANDVDPAIATDNKGSWFIAWASSANLGGKLKEDYDILGIRSTDNGVVWKDLAAVNNNADNDSEGWCPWGCTPGKKEDDVAPSVATNGKTWRVAWSGTSRVLNIAQSGCQDYGHPPRIHVQHTNNIADLPNISWMGPYCVGTTEENLTPALAADQTSNWVMPFVSSGNTMNQILGGDYDVLVTRSDDTQWPVPSHPWHLPEPLHPHAAWDNEHDLRPAIAVSGDTWMVVWQSAATKLEQGSGAASLGNDFDILVSTSTDAGKTWSPAKPLNNNAASDSGNDVAPAIAVAGSNWVVAWASNDALKGTIDTDYDILVATSNDKGATWTDPRPAASNADSDTGDDTAPAIASDGKQWVAVWQSTEDGGSGADTDILFTRFTLPLP